MTPSVSSSSSLHSAAHQSSTTFHLACDAQPAADGANEHLAHAEGVQPNNEDEKMSDAEDSDDSDDDDASAIPALPAIFQFEHPYLFGPYPASEAGSDVLSILSDPTNWDSDDSSDTSRAKLRTSMAPYRLCSSPLRQRRREYERRFRCRQ